MNIPPTKIVLLAIAFTAIAVPKSRCEWSVWTSAHMITAEELASSGALAPVAIPTKLSNFRYPYLQQDGSVIFIANDHLKPTNKEGRAGIFKIENNEWVTTLTSAGEGLANAEGKVACVIGLKVCGGRAVFNVSLDNGVFGIALWENGQTMLLASSNGPEGFLDFGYPDISEDMVVFSAEAKGSGSSLYAIDLHSAERRVVAIVPSGTPIPHTEGVTFRGFAASQFADGADVVFRAYSEDYNMANIPASGYSGAFRSKAFSKDLPQKIADTTTQIPGAATGQTFSYHLESAIPEAGYTVIVNKTSKLKGVYLASPEGKIEVIADTNTAIPDLFAGPFTWFNKWVSNCAPWVLFLGGTKDYLGLFALNIESHELFLLADSRMKFDGKRISGAEISNSAKVGDKVALMLEFSDGSSGVYVATFGKGLAMQKAPADRKLSMTLPAAAGTGSVPHQGIN